MTVENFTKKELVTRLRFKCKHGHNGLRHPQCFKDKKGTVERIGFLDIETTNLRADYGYVLSYCILSDTGKLYSRVITTEEIHNLTFDKNLMKQLCEDIKNFDRLVVYWGSNKRFDIPFLRTRAEVYKLDFPTFQDMWVTDVYDMARFKLKLRNNRLATVCEHLGIAGKQHPLLASVWQKALAGHKQSLNYVLIHNKEDVYSTRDVFNRLVKYVRLTKSSI